MSQDKKSGCFGRPLFFILTPQNFNPTSSETIRLRTVRSFGLDTVQANTNRWFFVNFDSKQGNCYGLTANRLNPVQVSLMRLFDRPMQADELATVHL